MPTRRSIGRGPAYRFTVETSVYVAPHIHRRGVGKALLIKLIEACTALGFRQMIAVIGDLNQAASIGVHRACGFTDAGNLRAIGWKFGRWLDTPLMQLTLGPGATAPPQETERKPGQAVRPAITPALTDRGRHKVGRMSAITPQADKRGRGWFVP